MHFAVRPSNGHKQHIITDDVIIPEAGRTCQVDEKQEAMFAVKGDVLSLSSAGYEHVRGLFGSALICEPVGGLDSAASALRIAELEAKVAELEQQLATRRK